MRVTGGTGEEYRKALESDLSHELRLALGWPDDTFRGWARQRVIPGTVVWYKGSMGIVKAVLEEPVMLMPQKDVSGLWVRNVKSGKRTKVRLWRVAALEEGGNP